MLAPLKASVEVLQEQVEAQAGASRDQLEGVSRAADVAAQSSR